MVQGPPQGYFPDPTKSILVVSPHNVPRAKDFFGGYGLQIVTVSRYLEGVHGERDSACMLDGGEGCGMAGLGGHLVWGGAL